MTSNAESETELIKRIKGFFGTGDGRNEGIGDDAAVIPIDERRAWVVTTDLLVENVDFLRAYASPRVLGRKTLSVSLSDVAAMGAEPRFVFLSCGFPKDLDAKWRDELLRGFAEAARQSGTIVLGGDLSASSEVILNALVIGEAPRDRILRRSSARSGDLLFVTGPLGDSCAGLELVLEAAGAAGKVARSDAENLLVERHYDPRAHLAEARILSAVPGVTALMDVSDGLASDLPKLLEASGGLSFEIDLSSIPLSEELRAFASSRGRDPVLDYAWPGGEDYVLLGTCAPGARGPLENAFASAGRALRFIGRVLESGESTRFVRYGEETAAPSRAGHDHFK